MLRLRHLILASTAALSWTAAVPAAPDFETQVLPVLTRAGCNTGACHGAAIGRGGFRLSLLGYDPQGDYEVLIHEFKGRRVNLARPEKSLLLAKPTRQLPHEGGHKLAKEGDGYQVILDWIKAGAPAESRRKLQGLEITPIARSLTAPGQKFTIDVFARFSDGNRENVTRWVVFTPADTTAVRCSANGEVTALRPGQSSIMVRFLGEVGSVSVLVPIGGPAAVPKERPRKNFIDEHVNRTLDELCLPNSPPAEDRVLVRRLFLDLIGTLPQPAEVEAYIADPNANRFARLVDRLMARPEFVDHWAYKWGDLLRIESRRLGGPGSAAFHQWVRDQVNNNTPLDRMARDMLLTLGDATRTGPANFSRIPGDPRAHAEFVSQVFLGVRLQCANCHNHPLDRWTQDDYHGLAAVFARVSRTPDVRLLDRGEAIHPKTGAPAVPRIPGQSFITGDGDPRERIAGWLTGPDNPFFARSAVNRIWRELMGRGLVEPVDDHRATNPATHPALLDALAGDFAKHGFDVRHTIRTIVGAAAYQRSSRATGINRTDDRFYSRALVRPLPPVVMVDAVAKVTGVAEKLGALPEGTSAISLGDAQVRSLPLDLLGRCHRDAGCTEAPGSAGSLPLTLHKINGDWLNAKIVHPQGRLHQLVRDKKSAKDIVTTFYQTALGRKPSGEELGFWQSKLDGAKGDDQPRMLEDFLWAVLNSTEFCCNH
jgi:hypothetical protein